MTILRYLRSSVSVIFGNAVRVVLQGLYYVIAARLLGASEFGVFVTIYNVCGILYPFSALGMGNIMTRIQARRPGEFWVYWRVSMKLLIVSGLCLTGLMAGIRISHALRTGSLAAIIEIAVAEFGFVAVGDMAAQALAAMQRQHLCGLVQTCIPAFRSLGAFLLFTLPTRTLSTWSTIYLVSSALGASLCMGVVQAVVHGPHSGFMRIRLSRLLREGFMFSLAQSAQSIYNNVDKAILGSAVSSSDAAVYSVAYKVADVAFMPVKSMLMVSYRDFFDSGRYGLRSSLYLATKLMIVPITYTVIFGSICSAFSGLVIRVFGLGYSDGAMCLQYLAWLPALKVIQYYFGDALTGAGFQALRTAIQCGAAVANFLGGMIVIPRHSLMGATVLSLITDGLLAVSMFFTVKLKCRQMAVIASSDTVRFR